MKKFFKNVFWLGVFSAVAYYGYKFYQRVKSLSNLHNTLPQYLENIIGESPKQKINMQLKSLVYDLWFTKETLEQNDNIEEMIREYIDDFYPAFKGMNIEININEKLNDEESEEEPENDEEIETEEEHTEDEI